MAEGRQRENWTHTSEILATLVNCHRTKGRAIRAAEVNPFTAGSRREKVSKEEGFAILRKMIVGNKPGRRNDK